MGCVGSGPGSTAKATGGLAQRLRPIRDAVDPHREVLKNREPTNRLLMLVQLHANGDDSEVAYRTGIRDWLAANAVSPRGSRRAITNPCGVHSLR